MMVTVSRTAWTTASTSIIPARKTLDSDGMGDACDNCPRLYNQYQEDTYPPQTNGCGDACECEGNFNGWEDEDVDGSDAFIFKTDFGRSRILDPCTNADPCNGDFTCDYDVDGTDAFTFKSDFGRSSHFEPLPLLCNHTLVHVLRGDMRSEICDMGCGIKKI